MPYTSLDDKYYNSFRNDLQKIIFVQFGSKFEGNKSQHEIANRATYSPRSEVSSEFKLRENRDKLKGRP